MDEQWTECLPWFGSSSQPTIKVLRDLSKATFCSLQVVMILTPCSCPAACPGLLSLWCWQCCFLSAYIFGRMFPLPSSFCQSSCPTRLPSLVVVVQGGQSWDIGQGSEIDERDIACSPSEMESGEEHPLCLWNWSPRWTHFPRIPSEYLIMTLAPIIQFQKLPYSCRTV